MTRNQLVTYISENLREAVIPNSITPTILSDVLEAVMDFDSRPYKVYTALLTQSGTKSSCSYSFREHNRVKYNLWV